MVATRDSFIIESVVLCTIHAVCAILSFVSTKLADRREYGGTGTDADDRYGSQIGTAVDGGGDDEAAGKSPALHPQRAVVRTFPWWSRRIMLVNGWVFTFSFIDVHGYFGILPQGVVVPVSNFGIGGFWAILSIWLYYHSKAVYSQIRRGMEYPPVLFNLLCALPAVWWLSMVPAGILRGVLNRQIWVGDIFFAAFGLMALAYTILIIATYTQLRNQLNEFLDSVHRTAPVKPGAVTSSGAAVPLIDTAHITSALQTIRGFTIGICSVGAVMIVVCTSLAASSPFDFSEPADPPPTEFDAALSAAHIVSSIPAFVLVRYCWPRRVLRAVPTHAAMAAVKPKPPQAAAGVQTPISIPIRSPDAPASNPVPLSSTAIPGMAAS